MSTYNNEQNICHAFRAGAKAFLSKDADPQQIREAVRKVAEGGSFVPPEISFKLAEWMSSPELSQREIEVLRSLAQGKSNKEIGSALFITEGTVKSHVRSILSKLNAVGRAEAIGIAAKPGLIPLA
ncbi:MAG TPA: response regulator transcription factor [Chthoniobacterales bacterium]|nr:response regulator transcription factor [Chthoniobacterales bacterium]